MQRVTVMVWWILAILSSPARCLGESTDHCGRLPFLKVPTHLGLDECVGNNAGALTSLLASTQAHCSVLKLNAIYKSQPLAQFAKAFEQMLASPRTLSQQVYSLMANTSTKQMEAFCNDLNELVAPCAQALAKRLLAIIQQDRKCCSQLGDALEMLRLVVPSTQSYDHFLMNDLLNNVNRMLCTRRQHDQKLCASVISDGFTHKFSPQVFRLLSSFALPLMSVLANQTCDAIQGQLFYSTSWQEPMQTVDYSCCFEALSPLIQMLQRSWTYLLGSSPADFLNGIVDFSHNGSSFHAIPVMPGDCSMPGVCFPPRGLINVAVNLSQPLDSSTVDDDKKQVAFQLPEINCTLHEKCNSKGDVCSMVCQRGSAQTSQWLQQTLRFQRQLAFDRPLCFAQLPATHNSIITLADGYGNRDQLFNAPHRHSSPSNAWMRTNNQLLSVTDQLNLGIRFVEIDTHFFLGDFYSAHCGNFGSPSMQLFFQVAMEQLTSFGKVVWAPELLGCFPSLSGIAAQEQVRTLTHFHEIRAWLDLPGNEHEWLMVYLDNGDEIARFNQTGALDALVADVFGDLIVPKDHLNHENVWKNMTINRLIRQGYRVLVVANDETETAFRLRTFCGKHSVIDTKYIAQDVNETLLELGGIKLYDGTLTRSFQSVLRYLSLDDTGHLTEQHEEYLTSANIGLGVRWNINLMAPDLLDGSMLKAMVWTWQEGEPNASNLSTNSTRSVFVDPQSSRWLVSNALHDTLKACYNSNDRRWEVINRSLSCSNGFAFGLPKDPLQNRLLQLELQRQQIQLPVLIQQEL